MAKQKKNKTPPKKRYFISLDEGDRIRVERLARLTPAFRWNGKGNPMRLIRSLISQLCEGMDDDELLRAAEGDLWKIIEKSKIEDV